MTHPASALREWWFLHTPDLGDERRDADQDYLESDSEAARICLRHDPRRGAHRRLGVDGRGRAPSPEPTAMLGLWEPRRRLRSPDATPVRVRPPLGPPRVFSLHGAARRLPA